MDASVSMPCLAAAINREKVSAHLLLRVIRSILSLITLCENKRCVSQFL